jgi:uncharacterized Fe-S center protein
MADKSTLYFAESDEAFRNRLEEQLKPVFKPGESIAVKLHMGEQANPHHFKPEFVKTVVDVLKKIGVKPFLFDSPVMYNSGRHTVEGYEKQNKKLGFTEQVVGCPVIVSNESNKEVKGKHMSYQVCRHLEEADGVLVLTHFTGHICAGFGGSIKNLGMGALTRETKKAIHKGGNPKQELLAKCSLCRKCQEVCIGDAITYNEENDEKGNEKQNQGPVFNYDTCYGCSKCIQNCPNKCLEPKTGEIDVLLAEGANAALSRFKKTYFVNVLRDITNRCDCQRAGLEIVLQDIGFLMGRDIVAIDRAGLDIVNRKAGHKIFNELWHKDASIQVTTAAEMGMGSLEYEVKDA